MDFERIAVFCYGSNSTKQLQERVQNMFLISCRAYTCGYKRIFAGNAVRWGGGGAASLVETNDNNDKVIGTIVYLSLTEINLLDRFEGIPEGSDPFDSNHKINVYRREYIDVCLTDNTKINAIVYIKNNHEWYDYPSITYLEACYNHLVPFWVELDGDHALHVYCGNRELKGKYYGPKSELNTIQKQSIDTTSTTYSERDES